MKYPLFKGDMGDFILKVKSSYVAEEEKKINDDAIINLKQYEYENKKYYVNKIKLYK